MLSNHGWLCLPRGVRLATDRYGPLVRPADDLDLERHRRRRQDVLELIRLRDGLPADLDDQVSIADPRPCRRAVVLDVANEDPVAAPPADPPPQIPPNP